MLRSAARKHAVGRLLLSLFVVRHVVEAVLLASLVFFVLLVSELVLLLAGTRRSAQLDTVVMKFDFGNKLRHDPLLVVLVNESLFKRLVFVVLREHLQVLMLALRLGHWARSLRAVPCLVGEKWDFSGLNHVWAFAELAI